MSSNVISTYVSDRRPDVTISTKYKSMMTRCAEVKDTPLGADERLCVLKSKIRDTLLGAYERLCVLKSKIRRWEHTNGSAQTGTTIARHASVSRHCNVPRYSTGRALCPDEHLLHTSYTPAVQTAKARTWSWGNKWQQQRQQQCPLPLPPPARR